MMRTHHTIAVTVIAALSLGCPPAQAPSSRARPADACAVSHQGDGGRIRRIFAGDAGTCALFNNGTALCWGAIGRMSRSSECPLVDGLVRATEIALGEHHACATVFGGEVRCWGWNYNNQLGPDRKEGCKRKEETCDIAGVPVTAPGVEDALRIAAQAYGSCAIVQGGNVYCWGLGTDGDGDVLDNSTPRRMSSLHDVDQLAIGVSHLCARFTDGTAACWGQNSQGALGTGTTRPKAGPSKIPGLTGVVEVVAGAWSSCARLRTGKLACWGNNSSGELGDGTKKAHPTPVEVPGIDDAIGIGIGITHTCALRKSGKVFCWGGNMLGQLGDGTFEERLRPTEVRGLEGVVQIALGTYHSCALLAGGEVMCWGRNQAGELGDYAEKKSPVPIPALKQTRVAAPP